MMDTLLASSKSQKYLQKQAYLNDKTVATNTSLPDKSFRTSLSGSRNCRERSHCQLSPVDGDCETNSLCVKSVSLLHGDNDDSGDDENFIGELDEIPVWVRGEQRWISGVTEDTTCDKLVEALLDDEGIDLINNNKGDDGQQLGGHYVITERWRRVEQILSGRTKIWKIWAAWGDTQSEVRLSLRRIESTINTSDYHNHHHLDNTDQNSQSYIFDENGDDSGRESPTPDDENGRPSSAIVRRKKHRSWKSSSNWATNSQTIHPIKSHKTSIEKLMKLILEQGETIQQQLSKLRDREQQITKLEDAKHQLREQQHGKNYLLETYLNGLHETSDKDNATGNSDSGVHTEDAASPDVRISSDIGRPDDDLDLPDVHIKKIRRKSISSNRESKLFREQNAESQLLRNHDQRRDFTGGEMQKHLPTNNNIAKEIEALEKLVAINKHLQREEELIVRLSAKIKRYESDNPTLTEIQILEAIKRAETDIENSNLEMKKMEHELEKSTDMLAVKSNVVNSLSTELKLLDELKLKTSKTLNQEKLINNQMIPIICEKNQMKLNDINTLDIIPPPPHPYRNVDVDDMVNLSSGQNLKEQIEFYTTILPTPNTSPYSDEHQMIPAIYLQQNLNKPSTINLHQTTPLNLNAINNRYPFIGTNNYNSNQHLLLTQTPVQFFQKEDCGFSAVNLLSNRSCDQRNLNCPVTTALKYGSGFGNSSIASNCKVGPKKFLNGFSKDPDSDTGLSSMGEDVSQLGTLV